MKKLASKTAVAIPIKNADDFIKVKVAKSQARFKRVKNPKGADSGIGEYLLIVEVTAHKDTVYVPLSIASGKKVTGFVYQIEGTGTGLISTAGVSAKGEGVTQVTLGTILYCKIPATKKAEFRMQIEMKGKIGKTYTVHINQINYKLNTSDARYKRYTQGVSSRPLEFK